MAEELVDMILPRVPCRTAEVPLNIPPEPEEMTARIRKAVEREYARRLPDFLYVSTYLGYERPMERAWLEPVAREMSDLLGSLTAAELIEEMEQRHADHRIDQA
jgi:hypothetical protein